MRLKDIHPAALKEIERAMKNDLKKESRRQPAQRKEIYMKRVTQKRRLKKSVREALQVIVIGTIGAALLVGLWIGSVIQTSERLSTMTVEVDRG